MADEDDAAGSSVRLPSDTSYIGSVGSLELELWLPKVLLVLSAVPILFGPSRLDMHGDLCVEDVHRSDASVHLVSLPR